MAGTSLLDTIFRRRKKKTTEFTTDYAVFEFAFDTIRAATNEFSDLVGRGGFSSVFKGKLQSGQEIAVKRLSENSNGTERHFHNEVELLSKLRHKNLINLLGFCTKRDQNYLVYEFMPNSSLDRFIFDPQRASALNWEMCRNIVQGIARGLRYLHEESGLWVVHRDMKPQNILLDSDLKPKIAGFELARMMQQGENEAETTIIAGTIGYLDPEYMRSGRVSIKSDVYAFGVTILTIISRRKAWSVGEDAGLVAYVMRLWDRGEAINVIHEVMRAEEREDSISEILRYIHIALLCIDENAETRPSLDKVLHWFGCFSTPLPEPTIGNRFLEEEETNRFLAEEETNWSLSPSLSPGHSSVTSPVS
ncbi:Cysteine-rich receptor-like protein kinase 45 [Cardamine amara subsp. amara]|uniref:Cysteine-rich receptor-like protein kinase 45 n=1 Tax=Cardamine amara subsp. amara TaxID=228776 RepID=A0ABD1BHU3_CARAN